MDYLFRDSVCEREKKAGALAALACAIRPMLILVW